MQLHLISFITVKNKTRSGAARVSLAVAELLREEKGRYIFGDFRAWTQTVAHVHIIKEKHNYCEAAPKVLCREKLKEKKQIAWLNVISITPQNTQGGNGNLNKWSLKLANIC